MVVPSVIPEVKADEYVRRAYSWLEGFGKGFKGDDRSTWKPENLPAFNKGGLFNRHASGHEQWVWDIRSEPAVIDVFAKLWGTEELFVSFGRSRCFRVTIALVDNSDGVNVSLPFDETADVDRRPWPHVDQSPQRRFKHCVQGIMNLVSLLRP